MRVQRSFLYWGAFFVALGAVLLAANLNGISDAFLRDALRLWPAVLIAAGIALVLRRTRVGWAGGMVAAAMPGLMLGGMIAAAPRISAICDGDLAAPMTTRTGSFTGPASVDLVIRCGRMEVGTAPGTTWRVDADARGGWVAGIDESPTRLRVASGRENWFGSRNGSDAWRATLPTGVSVDLDVKIDAGSGRLVLAGASLGRTGITVNAGDGRLDLTGATLSSLRAEVNAGALRIVLPAGSDYDGTLAVNAGDLRICAPADLGLRVRATTSLASARIHGLVASGDTWESPDYATARHHAQLSVDANLGSIEINPTGGCQ